MTESVFIPPAPLKSVDSVATAARIARSTLSVESSIADMERFHEWFTERGEKNVAKVERIALHDLVGWHTSASTGNIGHDSGKFFTVEGLEIQLSDGPVPSWDQPIIVQPEFGILGVLVKEFDGILHFLMQAKNEPGNCNGVQLSPTVQATKSNYTRIHRGSPVPYLEYFQDTNRHHVISDVLQSEQGSWFYVKRNRNMVVEVDEDIPLLENFHWLTLGQLHRLQTGGQPHQHGRAHGAELPALLRRRSGDCLSLR